LETGESWELEVEIIRADGQHIWGVGRGEVSPDGRLRGTLQEITQRKNIEDALRESESRFRNMADSAPVLIWMSDVSPLISFVNKFGTNYTGMSQEQLKGTAWLDAIHEEDRQRCVDIYTAAYVRREPFVYEYRIRCSDGEYQWFYCTSAPRFAANGEFLGYVGTCVDINDRKRAEESLQLALAQISELKNELHAENIYLREVINLEHNFEELIGRCDALKYVLFKIEQVASTDATVLITGETGTGKELVARAIHNTSLRKAKPLVTVNCAALSASLIESELFGHERGAFTGASARKIGRFELADGATIFLDEIGELPIELQAKLLRVIQEGEFERLGSAKTLKADVRIIAATNRDLESEVRKGAFREDLLFRLNVFPITVPPLRERIEDIRELVEYFANRFSKKIGKKIRSVSPATIRRLSEHSWPGNIRELANVIERSVINTQSETLHVSDIFAMPAAESGIADSDATLEMIERKHITKILEQTRWKIEGTRGAAVILGMNPSTLRTRMAKLGIFKRRPQNIHS
jgi:PAS domain S-box-containing protein